ncbi:carbohydrate binding domain protein [Vibrio cholerae]|nr:carbohydrate binding domain protein [Vibrio cholerae]
MLTTKKGIVAATVAVVLATPVQVSGIQSFLDALRNFESGINPAQADFYLQNFDNPVYTYAQVTSPGRLVRDCSTGSMISEPTTINQFFTKLGVNTIYNPLTPTDAEMFRQMQYNSMNAWGFIGYQLGEAVLIDAGYYSPKLVNIDGKEYDSFYMFVPDSTWVGCKTEALAEIEGSGGNKVYVTDNNRWEGTFVGKNGVNSLADLRLPEKQELVMRDAMHFNVKVISKLLADANMTWEQALAKSWLGKDANGNPIQIQATMSGILAAAHLRGAWGTGALLTKDQITCDELGTCITTYVHKFGGFNTIFDTPANDVIEGSQYNEVLSAGWGNDTVVTGGGIDQILLNEQLSATTTIADFTVGEDKIILRGWQATDPLAGLVVASVAGGTELQFSGQTVVLSGVNAADVQANPAAVIAKSDIYKLAWNSGKKVVTGFDPLVDKIEGSAGIGFKHLKAYETATSVVVGPQAEDGGIYASYELVGLTLADINPDMLVNVTGGYDRLGYIVPLNSVSWGWNVQLVVNNFYPAKTVITTASNEAIPFNAVKLTQAGADTVLTLLDPFAQGNKKSLVLKNTQLSVLTASNFAGFTGNFNEVTVDVPVFYQITASISGTGGVISPTPDAAGIISAQGGADFTVNFIADSGYKVSSIVVNGVSQPVANSFTFPSLAANQTLVVSFEPGSACPANWVAGKVYVGGDQVVYQGNIYQAKWWNDNNQPDQGGPWQLVGACN